MLAALTWLANFLAGATNELRSLGYGFSSCSSYGFSLHLRLLLLLLLLLRFACCSKILKLKLAQQICSAGKDTVFYGCTSVRHMAQYACLCVCVCVTFDTKTICRATWCQPQCRRRRCHRCHNSVETFLKLRLSLNLTDGWRPAPT